MRSENASQTPPAVVALLSGQDALCLLLSIGCLQNVSCVLSPPACCKSSSEALNNRPGWASCFSGGAPCRVRSDCMLGLQCSPGSFTPLGLVHPQGGLVPQIVLLVQRKHPNLMWQRTSDGCTTVTSLHAHAAAIEAAEANQEKVLVLMYCQCLPLQAVRGIALEPGELHCQILCS